MPLKLVNIGSSFAAGPSIPPVTNAAARRSGSNYANLVATKLGASLTDLSVSGATLETILREPQRAPGETFAPQIELVPEDADVILVLGGGNDMGYIVQVLLDCAGAYWASWMLLKAINLFTEFPALGALDGDGVEALYGTVLDELHKRAPKAQIVVVEYFTLFGPDVKEGDVPFSLDKLDRHRDTATQLQKATAAAVAKREAWCIRVPVAGASEGHGLGSVEPWMNGFSWRLVYEIGAGVVHPNLAGMKAVADMVYERIRHLG